MAIILGKSLYFVSFVQKDGYFYNLAYDNALSFSYE